jgi:hypothetical protein
MARKKNKAVSKKGKKGSKKMMKKNMMPNNGMY